MDAISSSSEHTTGVVNLALRLVVGETTRASDRGDHTVHQRIRATTVIFICYSTTSLAPRDVMSRCLPFDSPSRTTLPPTRTRAAESSGRDYLETRHAPAASAVSAVRDAVIVSPSGIRFSSAGSAVKPALAGARDGDSST